CKYAFLAKKGVRTWQWIAKLNHFWSLKLLWQRVRSLLESLDR
ncbi:MAG: hypothetical protein ACI82I_000240, partial [Gammaproteobacteria bacterium]